MPPQFVSGRAYSTSFFQSSLPSARAKQRRLRTVPRLLAWVGKIRSRQTTGVELPAWASGTFHLTLSLSLHVTGRFFSKQTPCPVGPRQAGQLSAWAAAVLRASRAETARQRGILFSGAEGRRVLSAQAGHGAV